MPEITPYHATLKWPAIGGGAPEIMVNLHAETPEDLDDQLAHIMPLINAHLPGLLDAAPVAQAAPTPANVRRLPEPTYEPDPDSGELPSRCGAGHVNRWFESKHGGWYCAARDQNEERGFCRWIISADGVMRRQAERTRRAAGGYR